METSCIFARVGCRPAKSGINKRNRFFEPTGGLLPTHELSGFCFLRLAVRAKLWLNRSLVQVNAPFGAGNHLFLRVFFFLFYLIYSVGTRFIPFSFSLK